MINDIDDLIHYVLINPPRFQRMSHIDAFHFIRLYEDKDWARREISKRLLTHGFDSKWLSRDSVYVYDQVEGTFD